MTTAKTTDVVDEDGNEDPNGYNGKDNNGLIFDTTTILWLDVRCIPGKEGG